MKKGLALVLENLSTFSDEDFEEKRQNLVPSFIFAIIFLIYKFFYNRNKNERKKYYKILKEVDLSNSKQSAYIISKYTRLLATSQREEKLVEELIEELDSYKYKKEVEELNDDVKIIFARFMDSVDV